MDSESYFFGFLTTAGSLIIQHILWYKALLARPEDDQDEVDRKTLKKFGLGVAAILAGCIVAAAVSGNGAVAITPIVCSAAGWVVIGAYAYRRAVRAGERRGRLKGIADRADIAEDTQEWPITKSR